MPRQSFIVDLRFDGGRQAERVLESIGQTGERSMDRVQSSSRRGSRGLMAVNDASRAVRDSVDELANRLGPLGAGMRALGPAGTAAAAGIAGVTAGLVQGTRQARQAVERFAELGEQAQQLGVTTQALQELRFAAGAVGVAEDRLDDGLQELNSRLGELQNGAGELNSFLEELGAEGFRRALQGAEDTEEAFRLIIDQLGSTESTFDRAALAAAAFGEEGGRAMQRLAEQDVADLRQAFRDLGIEVDESLIKQSQDARGELNRLDTRIQNNIDIISAQFTPVLIEARRQLARFTGQIRELGDEQGTLEDIFNILKDLPVFGLPIAGTSSPLTLGDLFGGGGRGGSGGDGSGGGTGGSSGGGPSSLPPIEVNPPEVMTPRQRPDTPSGFNPTDPTMIRQGGRTTGAEIVARSQLQAEQMSGMQPAGAIDPDEVARVNDLVAEQRQALTDLGQSIRESVMTPTERYHQRVADLNAALRVGSIDQETYARAAEDAAEQLREGTGVVREQARAHEYLEDVGTQAFDRVGSAITDAYARGEGAAINFGSVARGVFSELMQSMLELAAINPLKNALFGGDRATLSSVGGIIGDFIGGLGNTTATPTADLQPVNGTLGMNFADGGSFMVGPQFPRANAGRDNRFVGFYARDGERVNVSTPESQRATGPGVEINIINEGQPMELQQQRERTGPDGKKIIDAMVVSKTKDAINSGALDREMAANFGLRRQGRR